MKRREIVAGVLLAIALAAGVLFVRLRHQPVAAGDGPTVDLDLSKQDGRMVLDGVAVDVAVEPRPARVYENLRFRFRVTEDGSPVHLEEARVSFRMTMDMGPHDYRLVQAEDAWIVENVVLPACGSGSRLWFGDLELRWGVHERRGSFAINLAPED